MRERPMLGAQNVCSTGGYYPTNMASVNLVMGH